MNGDQPSGTGSLPLSLDQRVDEACDRFEKAWRAGQRPRIEDYVTEAPGPARGMLLRELLAVEIELRSGGPEKPTPEEYQRRFPGHDELIAAAFAHSLAERVDVTCDLFAEDWRAGRRPRIEDYLAEAPELPCGVLLRELLALEIELRSGEPESPTPEEYQRRFPGHDELIAAAFAQASRDRSGRLPDSDEGATTPHRPPAHESAGDAGLSPPAGSPPAPDHIGRYEVVGRLGGGTFGEVYLAHDGVMDRQVAIKVPSAWLVATERAREEFLREARNVARLQHEGIVRAYDFGQEVDGRCYIVYEFIDGASLAERLKPERIAADPLPPEEAARIVAEVAEALHYAHLQGLVHRDVKPANILVDRHGNPKVADFGLAAREEDLPKQRGVLAGTLGYMSPEQVRREGHRLDGRSDVYGLGAVLYELLCSRRPFTAMTEDELIDQVLHREARPLRQVRDSIPRELERICLKALSKRINDRYTTAKDMADELRRATRRVSAGDEAADTLAASPLGNPVVEYLFVDERRLRSYLDQVWPTVSEAPAGAGHGLTTHECVVRLWSYLQRYNLAVPYRPRRPYEREILKNRLRMETMTARRAHIPVTEQAPTFPGLNLWVSVHPDDEIRVGDNTPGALFLIEDLCRGTLIAFSGYSSLVLLMITLGRVPAYRKLVDTWPTFLAEKEAKRPFAQDPVGTLVALGAQFGAERRIRALYRVRAACAERNDRAGIEPTECGPSTNRWRQSSTVTIGYPIVIEEA
jgi:hypothetical protein